MATEELTQAEIEELILGTLDQEVDASRLEIWREAVLKRSWEELEAIEHQGEILFPDKLWKRRASGKFEATPVMVRVPRLGAMRKARASAMKAAAQEGIDHKRDELEFSNLEDMHILAYAIRNATPPHEPLHPDPLQLEKAFDEGSLAHLKAKLGAYKALIDPRPEKMTRGDFISLVAAVAERRDIAPLVGIGSGAQNTFIVTMAVLLRSLMMRQSSLPSSESSTPEPSPTQSSESSLTEDD